MNKFNELHLPTRKEFLLPAPVTTQNGYECLSSYLQRCANNYFVSTVSLLIAWSEETANPMLSTFNSYIYAGGKQSYRINGRTELTEWLSKVLVKQDLLIKVNQMTVPKGDSFKSVELRKHLAWCPRCLEEQQKTVTGLHYPLLWMPKSYTLCQHHKMPMFEQCPSCKKYQPVVALHNQPGKCAHCFSFLGANQPGFPYGFQKELWRGELNEAITHCIRSKRYASRIE